MSKEKRVTWWKMFSHQRAVMESVSDKAAGAGLKAAFRYFDGEDIPDGSLTAQAFTVFCVIRPYIDEAKRDFERSVENGKKGAENRWGPHSPHIGQDTPPMGCLREAEAEAEKDYLLPDGNREGGAAKRTARPRFLPPTVEQVAEYVKLRGSKVDPQGFIDFYEAKGWLIGKTPMKDWKAACRNAERWERWDKKKDDPFPDYSGGDFFG